MASSKRKVAVQNFKREKTGIGKNWMIIYRLLTKWTRFDKLFITWPFLHYS